MAADGSEDDKVMQRYLARDWSKPRYGAPDPVPEQEAPSTCAWSECPSPAFIKTEPKDREHVRLPDGRTFHFACWFKMQQQAQRVVLDGPAE